MKSSAVSIWIILYFSLLTLHLYSQPCLWDGITFSSQEEIDSFHVNNPECTIISGDVEICGDDIVNLNGLNEVFWILGDIYIHDNPLLTNLAGLEDLETLGGGLKIEGNDSMVNFEGLDNLGSLKGNLIIGYDLPNLALTSLTGLEGIDGIGESLIIRNNPVLTSLAGLHNLKEIGISLMIGYYEKPNPVLTGLEGLESLTSIGQSLWLQNNAALTNLSGLGNVDSLGGYLQIIGNTSLSSLSGLDNIYFVGGDLWIIGNTSLSSLSELDNIYFVGGDLMISSTSLSSLTGLGNLTSISGNVTIGSALFFGGGNPSLVSLSGLNNLTSVGGSLSITDNPALESISALENLTSIGGILHIGLYYWGGGNASLTSLEGLENIDPGSITSLEINYNQSLSHCDVSSICDYLASPNGEIIIEGNADGCDSLEVVQSACPSTITSVWEYPDEELFSISPNPITAKTTIVYSLRHDSPVALKILDLDGQTIVVLVNAYQQQGDHKVIFNTAGLPAGMYFCVLQTAQSTETKKIIKLN